jgi:hypothetical protein
LLGQDLENRVSELDQYLDQVEVRLDEVAVANGVEPAGRP